jgi:AhpD family alkylhydroperoxidase
MSKNYPEMAAELTKAIGTMRRGIPDTMEAFSGIARAATKPGALDLKAKELIATAIAIAVRCDGCIAFHVKAVIAAGASRDELLETIGMAIYAAFACLRISVMISAAASGIFVPGPYMAATPALRRKS